MIAADTHAARIPGTAGAARVDDVRLNLTVPRALADRHKRAVDVLSGGHWDVLADDRIRVSVNLVCAYFGDVAARLEAVDEILSDPVLGPQVTGSVNEFHHAWFLLGQVMRKFDRVIMKEARR